MRWTAQEAQEETGRAREPSRRRGSAALVAVLGMFVLMAVVSLTSLTVGEVNVRHAGQANDDLLLVSVQHAAIQQSLAEIAQEADRDGDGGVGSVGLTQFRDSGGRVVAEYRTWTVDPASAATTPAVSPKYVVRAQVAVPNFGAVNAGNPNARRRTCECRVRWDQSFALNPKAGAISVAGPLGTGISLPGWGSAGFSINGNDPGPDGVFGTQPGPDGVMGTPDDVNDDRGGFPGVVFTDSGSRDNFVANNVIDQGNWNSGTGVVGLDDKVTGAPLETFAKDPPTQGTDGVDNDGDGLIDADDPNEGKFQAPFSLQPDAAFSAQMLNDYRDALRGYAEGLVSAQVTGTGTSMTSTFPDNYATAEGNGVIVLHKQPDVAIASGPGAGLGRLSQANYTFGTANVDSKVVLIDSSKFYQGGGNMTSNHAGEAGGSKITGAGTLIIMHPIGSTNSADTANGKSFNLDWTGDVFVIGYPKDRSTGVGQNGPNDNLLYLSRADWNVNGNVFVLSGGQTEASLEMQGTSANRANLNVNGAVMLFGEATTTEAEIDIESHATFQVTGMVGMYGKRAEIENQSGTNTDLQINGTLALGFPSGQTTTLELEVSGNADFRFNSSNVENATNSLAQLQQTIALTNSTIPQNLNFGIKAMVLRDTDDWATFNTEYGTLPANKGIDVTLIKARMAYP